MFSTVFQAGGLIVVVVEVTRKAYLASLVPVIVNAVLNEHQVIADIVAFVSQGDFPRSRLGEKQRGKVLASWVTRKLRTIAQFSIREAEGHENHLADAPQHRASRSSKPPSLLGNSLRRSTMVPENDTHSVPRSPAPVLEEYPQPLNISHEEPLLHTQDETLHMEPASGSHAESRMGLPVEHEASIASNPSPLPLDSPTIPPSSVPQIAEPSAITDEDEVPPGSAVSPIDHSELGFNFGDFSHATDATHQEPVSPLNEIDIPMRNAPGRDSLPSQRRFSSMPSGFGAPDERPGSQGIRSQPDTLEEEDWPQEALIYQSAMGSDDGGPLRSPEHTGFAKTTPYDGSEYGY